MSKFARDPYIVASSGRADGFGRRGRRVGALALYLDVARMERESEAWEFVNAAFRELANRALPPSKSRRPGSVRFAEQRKRWHRMLDVLMLRYVHGFSYEQIGARLREPVSRERVRQMIAKGLRLMRHPVRFQPFRATMAQELDETTNPLPRPPDAGRDRPRRPEAQEAPSCSPGGTTAGDGDRAPRRGGEGERCTRRVVFTPHPNAPPPHGRTAWECGLALPCPYHDAPKVEESR